MAKYVLLLQFTDQGIRSVKDTTKRAAAFRGEIAGKFGVKVSEVLWTLGQYDGGVLAEAPNDEAMAACSLRVARLGNVKIQTLRAFQTPEVSDSSRPTTKPRASPTSISRWPAFTSTAPVPNSASEPGRKLAASPTSSHRESLARTKT